MGAFLDKPQTEKHSTHGSGNGLTYGLSCMQGWRCEMEDAHCALVGLPEGLSDWSFFAVFDGHAGARVSAHCAENLLDTIIQSEDFKNNANTNDNQVTAEDVGKVKKGIKDGFLRFDERMRNIPEIASGDDKSGSTAVCCLISSTHFYFANCGDSRALLCRDRNEYYVTEDHKPINPVEKERIQKAGGSVMVQRVNGSLAVSRALGDFDYKQVEGKGPCEQLVSPEPQVDVVQRDNEKDEFLVLACDGVWDVISNEEICQYIAHMLRCTTDLEYICNTIIDNCFVKGSKDNMSIVIVALPGAPKISQACVLDHDSVHIRLKTKIEEIMEQRKYLELNDLMSLLDKCFVSSFDIGFKYSFIEKTFNELKNSQKFLPLSSGPVPTPDIILKKDTKEAEEEEEEEEEEEPQEEEFSHQYKTIS